MLFDNITTFKAFAGGAVNYSVELGSLEPTMHAAARQHIVPWITSTVLDHFVQGYAGGSLNTQEEELLPYLQRPLAMLTMYEYARIGGVQFSEAGIMRAESETHKSAFKYQENAYREYMQEHGFNALETLLEYLDANADTFPDWRDGGGRTRYRATLLHRHTELSDIIGRNVSRFTFHLLRPVIADVELFALQTQLGEPFLNHLREAWLDASLTAAETTLLSHIRKVLAHFTFAEAVKRLYVQVSGDRVVQVELTGDQGHRNEMTAALSPTGLLIDTSSEWANRHFSYLLQYLGDNEEEFPLYESYRETVAEALALSEVEAHTDERAASHPLDAVIDRTDYGTPTPKGVVRL